jgi:adenosylcobinamide-GDP ribazoletransferase
MLLHELRLFFLALQFLTRVPIPDWVGFEADWLHASARYFPLVGALVGATCALVLWVCSLLFPVQVAVLLAMLWSLCLTGAFHEDGLADTLDALGGVVPRAKALDIMKDSRVGTYGAAALVMSLGLKAAVLSAMPLSLAAPSWVLGHSVSRASAVVLMWCLPYAGDVAQSKAKPMAYRVPMSSMLVACAWPLLLALAAQYWGLFCWPRLACAWAGVAVLTLVCGFWWQRRLGGITGDTLGATQQLTELVFLLLFLLNWHDEVSFFSCPFLTLSLWEKAGGCGLVLQLCTSVAFV